MIDSGFQDVVCQARKLLSDSPFQELHQIDVEQRGEVVLLRGEVATFFLKQIAQETVRSATRGMGVSNELLVAAVDLRRRLH